MSRIASLVLFVLFACLVALANLLAAPFMVSAALVLVGLVALASMSASSLHASGWLRSADTFARTA